MIERICSVEDCPDPARARGWCIPHYHRWRRHGDPLSRGSRQRGTCYICGDPLHGNGMCRLHWSRWRATGDPQPDKPNRMTRREDGKKWCPRCQRDLPADAFAKGANRKDGLAGHCRACQAAWRAANAERVAAGKVAWRQANVAKAREIHRITQANRRARKAGAGGYATADQVAARWAYYGGRCWICGAIATETDHVKPVAAKGASWASNLRPICGDCNKRKSDAWPYVAEVTVDGPRRSACQQAA